jgi:hypothetical protein
MSSLCSVVLVRVCSVKLLPADVTIPGPSGQGPSQGHPQAAEEPVVLGHSTAACSHCQHRCRAEGTYGLAEGEQMQHTVLAACM